MYIYLIKLLFIFQVVNQWEINGIQMPKLKKLEESRTSALRFCTRPFHLFSYNIVQKQRQHLTSYLKVHVLFSQSAGRSSSERCSRQRLWFVKAKAALTSRRFIFTNLQGSSARKRNIIVPQYVTRNIPGTTTRKGNARLTVWMKALRPSVCPPQLLHQRTWTCWTAIE